jgi:hypothetical protein
MSQFYGIQGLLYLLQSVFPFCFFQKNVPLIVRKIVLVSNEKMAICKLATVVFTC